MVNMYLKVQSQQNWHVRPCTCAWVGRIWWNSDCIMYIWARNVCTVWTRNIHRNQNYNKSLLIDQKGHPRPGEVKFRGSLRGYYLPINCCIKQIWCLSKKTKTTLPPIKRKRLATSFKTFNNNAPVDTYIVK